MGETLEIKELCELFHVERRTLYRWIKEGKLHGVKFGRKWLFDRAEVEALLKRGGNE